MLKKCWSWWFTNRWVWVVERLRRLRFLMVNRALLLGVVPASTHWQRWTHWGWPSWLLMVKLFSFVWAITNDHHLITSWAFYFCHMSSLNHWYIWAVLTKTNDSDHAWLTSMIIDQFINQQWGCHFLINHMVNHCQISTINGNQHKSLPNHSQPITDDWFIID